MERAIAARTCTKKVIAWQASGKTHLIGSSEFFGNWTLSNQNHVGLGCILDIVIFIPCICLSLSLFLYARIYLVQDLTTRTPPPLPRCQTPHPRTPRRRAVYGPASVAMCDRVWEGAFEAAWWGRALGQRGGLVPWPSKGWTKLRENC